MRNPSKQIKVAVIKTQIASPDETEQSSPVSIYIYIAGLLVSMSGIYAATYDMVDTNFALVLRSLVLCGYCVSYWLRRNRVDLKQYQAPLLVVFATVMYFVASTAPELSSATSSNGVARPYQIQVVVIWIAVLQSFTLITDSAILFACVPSMALIGIMSSGTPDTEVQYAFFVFLAAATFLMVHENHLRTRFAMAQRNRSLLRLDNRLFAGEIVLVGCCILGTMLLATIVATPIEIVGRALIPANPQGMSKPSQSKQNAASANIHIDEGDTIDLGTGPPDESDAEVLSVFSTEPISYLREATFDYYTGRFFDNHLNEEVTLRPNVLGGNGARTRVDNRDSIPPGPGTHLSNEFDIDPYTMDAGTGRLNGAREVVQDVKVVGGTILHFYGAPAFKTVLTNFDSLSATKTGVVSASSPMIQGQDYRITSLVPNADPVALRRAGTEYPASVTSHYLQVANPMTDRNQRLQRFAEECTRGKTNPYDKVVALCDAIASRCNYNLQAPAPPRDKDIVEGFLFDSKQGYCLSFAAALTVLCRYVNVPSRFARGFIQGDRQNENNYTFRLKHLHAWTEVYFPNIGWIPFDATQNTHDITPSTTAAGNSITTPLRWLRSHGPLPPLMALAILVLIGFVLKSELLGRFRKTIVVAPGYEPLPVSNTEIVLLYQKACSVLASSGLSRALHVTPTEYRLDIQNRLPAASVVGEMLAELTSLHQAFAYCRATATETDVSAARSALDRLIAAAALLPKPTPVDRPGKG